MKNKRLFKLLFILLISLSTVLVDSLVYAEEIEYSDVLTDLTKDEDFNTGNYPVITDTNHEKYATASVIQIAEGVNKELYIYTYEPSNSVIELELISVVMWNSFNDKGFEYEDEASFVPIEYNLKLVSENNIFKKYVLLDYTVSSEVYRYYNISELYRKSNALIDENVSGGIISLKSIKVAQQWCCYYLNDELIYEMVTFEVVEVETVHIGHLNFSGGLDVNFFTKTFKSGDIHFIAFNIENYNATHIIDSYLKYKVRDLSVRTDYTQMQSTTTVVNDWQEIVFKITDDQVATYDGKGLFSRKFKWNRILTSDEFLEIKNVSFDEETISKIEKSKWVFSYLETERDLKTGILPSITTLTYSEVENLTLLSLHFMVGNKTYNLGCVMDKITADKVVDGIGTLDFDFLKEGLNLIKLILSIIAFLLILIFAWPVVSVILKIIIFIIKITLNIIFLPFKFLNKKKSSSKDLERKL